MSSNSQIRTLLGNLAAYGASEAASKVSRLLVVVTVARTLDLHEIGVAAAAMAAGDILKALTENGVGQRIIAARHDALEATCATAQRIFWAWCIGLFLVQAGIAGAISFAGGDPMLVLLVAILGVEYLFMPAGLVNVALAMREGNLKQTASIAGTQVVGANVISVLLVLIWPSALALVAPRVLSAPIWLLAVRRLRPWIPDRDHGFAPIKPFVRFGWAVLGIEVVKAIRLQADKMLVSVMLGAEALGIYFMAFNAGLSLSNAFTLAFSTVQFPHLTQAEDCDKALRQSFLVSLGLIGPAVILQALAAPYYVPILLGAGWEDISGIVQILCLVAIPTTLWTASAGWLRATDRPEVELLVTIALASGVVLNTVFLSPLGLNAVAVGYAITCTTIFCCASIPALLTAFPAQPAKA